MKPLIYVAHPYGGCPEALDRAELWLDRLSTLMVRALFWAPWIQLCRLWPDAGETRERGLELDLACVARSDGVLMVGGKVSPGMQLERQSARSCLDLTEFVAPEQLLQSPGCCAQMVVWIEALEEESNR
jgi:hypothetical protein